jgi:hypothetical protein
MWRRDWNLLILPPGAAGSFCSPTVYLKYEEILYSTVLDRVRSTYYVLSTIYYGWFHCGMPFPVPRRISGISVGRAGRIAADLFVHKKFIPSTAEETTTDDINNNAFNNIYK